MMCCAYLIWRVQVVSLHASITDVTYLAVCLPLAVTVSLWGGKSHVSLLDWQ